MKRPRIHGPGLGAIAAVLLAVSCASTSAGPGGSGAPSLISMSPATIVVGGKTLYLARKQDSFETAFLDAHDPRLLYVRYGRRRATSGKSSDPCGPLVRPFAYVEHQDATSVTIGIAGYRARSHRSGGSRTIVCLARIVGYERLPVRLAAPLGNRTVRGDLGSQPVQVVSEKSVPTPGWIPPGYVAKGLDVSLIDDIPERVYRHGRWELDILAGERRNFSGTRAPNTHVKQYPATMTVDGDFRTVTWTVSAQRSYEVDAFMADRTVGHGTYITGWADLTAAQVLRVASSLP